VRSTVHLESDQCYAQLHPGEVVAAPVIVEHRCCGSGIVRICFFHNPLFDRAVCCTSSANSPPFDSPQKTLSASSRANARYVSRHFTFQTSVVCI